MLKTGDNKRYILYRKHKLRLKFKKELALCKEQGGRVLKAEETTYTKALKQESLVWKNLVNGYQLLGLKNILNILLKTFTITVSQYLVWKDWDKG